MTRAPRPQYPYVARLERWSGFGVYVIRFAPDGTATKVVVLKSTGRAALDNACLGTLRMWRCQPGVYTTVVIPITFTMGVGRRPIDSRFRGNRQASLFACRNGRTW